MKPTTPGATRFITELLDRADQSEGKLPGKMLLSGYSVTEQQDVTSQLQRTHYTRAGKTVRINLDRWANDAYGGDKQFLLSTLYDAAGRQPDQAPSLARKERQELAAYILETGGYSEDCKAMSSDAVSGRGWVGGSLQRDGLQTTRRRVDSYLRLTSGLPLQDEQPLRSYCSRRLANSHALDDDGILRRAFERYILQRWPNHDESENAWMEAGLLIGSARGLAQAFGTLTLQLGEARVDLAALAKNGQGVGLERKFVETADLVELPRMATFVENPSTYTELRTKLPPGQLIALTDGFPSKATRALAQRLVKAGVQVRHWGDIDPEGFDILRQLGPGVKPLWMGEDIVSKADLLTPFGGKEARFRRRLVQFCEPYERAALQACMDRKGWIEQESLRLPDKLE